MFITLKKNGFPRFMKTKDGDLFYVLWQNLGFSHGHLIDGENTGNFSISNDELEEINEIITISHT